MISWSDLLQGKLMQRYLSVFYVKFTLSILTFSLALSGNLLLNIEQPFDTRFKALHYKLKAQ